MLAAFAACSAGEQAEFDFLQGERIRQSDIDFFQRCNLDPEAVIGDDEALGILLMLRAMYLEAEAQGGLPDWKEARTYAEAQYQELQAAAADEDSPGYDNAKGGLDYAQRLMQEVPLSEAAYLDYMALTRQMTEAHRLLQEQFVAQLPPELLEDPFVKYGAVNDYIWELVAKYQEQLVEPDLQPLLEAYLDMMLGDEQ